MTGYARFKPVESNYDLKINIPGVYVVKVTDEKTFQATALVSAATLTPSSRSSREHILVFAQDMKTGQGRKGARVLIADGSGVILEKKTGDDGVLLTTWNKPLAGSNPNAPSMPGPPRLPMLGFNTSCSTAATRRARAWACPTRWRRGSRLGLISTLTDPPIDPARKSPSDGQSPKWQLPETERGKTGVSFMTISDEYTWVLHASRQLRDKKKQHRLCTTTRRKLLKK